MTNFKFSLLLLWVLCLFGLSAWAQDSPAARELLAAAHQASGLAAIGSYELSANIVINPAAETPTRGRLTVYRDKDRFRYEIKVQDYWEIKLTLGSKLYVARSLPYPVPGLGMLREIDHAWDRLADDGDARLGDVSHKKVQHEEAECFDVKTEQKHRLCFDPAQKVLLESLDQARALEFSGYAAVEHQLVPRKITVLHEGMTDEKPILIVDEIQVKQVQFEDSAFAVPGHAQEFDTCANLQAAKPLKSPEPEFSQVVLRRNPGMTGINVYAVVDKDGNLQNVMVLSPDADVRSSTLEALKKWRYAPATCGTMAVSSELETQVKLPVMSAGGRSGRR